jgi:hypothetical protein
MKYICKKIRPVYDSDCNHFESNLIIWGGDVLLEDGGICIIAALM